MTQDPDSPRVGERPADLTKNFDGKRYVFAKFVKSKKKVDEYALHIRKMGNYCRITKAGIGYFLWFRDGE